MVRVVTILMGRFLTLPSISEHVLDHIEALLKSSYKKKNRLEKKVYIHAEKQVILYFAL